MSIKQKIWNFAILLFAIGMIVVCVISSDAYKLIQRTELIHYPYLSKVQALTDRLNAIQGGLLDALDSRSQASITRARENAGSFREITLDMAAIVGKNNISKEILAQFNEYFVAADSAASIIIGIKKGDARSDMARMTASLNKLTNTLQREQLLATQTFEESLVESRKDVQQMLMISLVSALAVFLTWTLRSVFSFLPFYTPRSSEDRRKRQPPG